MWATVIGSHLKKERTASPVLTKWWKLELTLATNFGNHAQMVTKFGGQILATKFGFVPDWWNPLDFSNSQHDFIEEVYWSDVICQLQSADWSVSRWDCWLLTLNVRGPSYLGLTRSISWLLMPWLLASPGHQQPWYLLCKIGKSWSYTRKDFNYLWHVSVEEWHKM